MIRGLFAQALLLYLSNIIILFVFLLIYFDTIISSELMMITRKWKMKLMIRPTIVTMLSCMLIVIMIMAMSLL